MNFSWLGSPLWLASLGLTPNTFLPDTKGRKALRPLKVMLVLGSMLVSHCTDAAFCLMSAQLPSIEAQEKRILCPVCMREAGSLGKSSTFMKPEV